jgi:hypothetical protein
VPKKRQNSKASKKQILKAQKNKNWKHWKKERQKLKALKMKTIFQKRRKTKFHERRKEVKKLVNQRKKPVWNFCHKYWLQNLFGACLIPLEMSPWALQLCSYKFSLILHYLFQIFKINVLYGKLFHFFHNNFWFQSSFWE